MANSLYPKYLDKRVVFLGADAGGKPTTSYNSAMLNWLSLKLKNTQEVLGKNFGSLSTFGISGAETANDIIHKRCMFDVSAHTVSVPAYTAGLSQYDFNFTHTTNGGASGDQRFLPNVDPIIFLANGFSWGNVHTAWSTGTQSWLEINDIEVLKDGNGYPYAVRCAFGINPYQWDRTWTVNLLAIQGWEH